MVAFSTDDEGLDRVGSMPPAQVNGSGSGRWSLFAAGSSDLRDRPVAAGSGRVDL